MPSKKSGECPSRNDENVSNDGENKECCGLPPLPVFLYYAIKEFLDCLFDWLLLYEINLLEEGLLSGPVTNIIWNCLFAFSCIGTIVSGIDIFNRFRKLRNGLTVSENSITEIGVMFLEDIPQLVIAVSILYCRREKSIWTVIKAAILMVSSCIAFKRMYNELKPVICKLVLITKKVLAVGHIAVAFFSAVTLLISLASWSFEITDNETWRNLTEGERIQKEYPKYFSNVSIYADTDDFQVPGHDLRSKAWIKFVEINYILKHGEIKTEITSDLHYLKIRTFFDGYDTNICYHLNKTRSDISLRKTTNCALFNGTTFHFYFKYMPPNSRYHFGDIEFTYEKLQWIPAMICLSSERQTYDTFDQMFPWINLSICVVLWRTIQMHSNSIVKILKIL